MVIVHVFIHVKPEFIEAFKAISLDNARNSIKEPGVARFDVIQQSDDPTRFVLLEVYRTPQDPPNHRQTAHYNAWKAAVEPMMAEPRARILYDAVFPDDAGWG